MPINVDYIEQRWIPELRSGRHDQCEEYLNNGIGKCCLGVLCDLRIQDGALAPWEDDDNGDNAFLAIREALGPEELEYVQSQGDLNTTTYLEGTSLPPSVVDFIGLAEDGEYRGYLFNGGKNQNLVQLNDSEHMTFNQIADELHNLCEWYRANEEECLAAEANEIDYDDIENE